MAAQRASTSAGGRAAADRGERVGRHQHRVDGLLGEAERAGEAVVLVVLDQALAAGLLDQRGDLLAGVRRAHLVHAASRRTRRSTAEATALMTMITGRSTVTMAQIGGPRTSAARSGPASARFFGIISPITTCR